MKTSTLTLPHRLRNAPQPPHEPLSGEGGGLTPAIAANAPDAVFVAAAIGMFNRPYIADNIVCKQRTKQAEVPNERY